MVITEQTRREWLLGYVASEDTITVNGNVYHISPYFEEGEGVKFYCVNLRNQRLGGTAVCLQPSWEQCNSGLALAYLYAIVLEVFEEDLKYHDGSELSKNHIVACHQ